jgi:hypothetical protein
VPYFTITDFAAGLDLRRSELTAPAGTLRTMTNCHITPGGEIEKRMAFVPFWNCDPATKGLVELNRKLYTFAPGGPYTTEPPSGIWSVGVLGQQCSSIYEVVDYDLFEGKVFAILWTDSVGHVVRCYGGASIPFATGLYCRTYKTKVYTVEGSQLAFSAVGDATKWYRDPPNTVQDGSGKIDLSLEDSDMTDCVALEVYYDKMAVFSSTAVQLWMMDPDPQKSTYQQTLRQAGTIAWRSVLQYGSGDVMYLSQSGIRSLRARNSSLAAAVSDIGSPLDPVIQDLFRYKGEDWMSGTIAVLQPVTGRFWIILPDRIFILSAFPGPKITAWSEYDPGFIITAAVVHNNSVVVRDDQNKVYAYGGISDEGPTYDDSFVELVFPFHAGNDVATYKTFMALDATCAGAPWSVYGGFNVQDFDAEDYFGQFNQSTFLQGKFAINGYSTHMSLRLRSQIPGPQTLSNLIVHYATGPSG